MKVRRAVGVGFYVFLFAVIALVAQQGTGTASKQSGGGPSAEQGQVLPKPTNLKVLPKETSAEDIDKLMHRIQTHLGVPCGYCHEQNSETSQFDYASDENPMKATARIMLRMTDDINTKYLAQLGDRRYADAITCGNCHQGQPNPPVFVPKSQ